MARGKHIHTQRCEKRTLSTHCETHSLQTMGERLAAISETDNVGASEPLLLAGKRGVTSFTQPAPRWAAYVHNLRSMGIEIVTIHEPHDGPFSGTHARYVLISKVKIGGKA